MSSKIKYDLQIIKFAAYGFFKNLRFFDPFIILFFKEQGITYLQIGMLYSFREISTAILEIPTGFVADSWGRKYSLMLSFLSYIASFLIFFFFPHFYIYFFAMFLYSLGDSLRSGTHKAIIMDYLKRKGWNDKKVQYYGFTRSWSQRGSALSSIIAGLMVFISGSYKYIFLASVIPYLIDFMLIMSYPDYLNGEAKDNTRNLNFVDTFKTTIKDFFAFLKKGKSTDIFLNSSVFDGMFKSVKDYIQPIIKSYSVIVPIGFIAEDKKTVVILSIIYFILYMLSAYSSQYSFILKKIFVKSEISMNKSYAIGMILIIFSGIFYVLNFKILSIIFFIFLYMLQNMRRPIAVEIISNRVKGNVLASGLSAESFLKVITTVLFSLLLGYFADLIGIGYALIILSGILIFSYPLVKLKNQ